MNLLKLVPKPIVKGLSAVGFFCMKNAPEILLAGGLVAGAAAVAVAVNETPAALNALDLAKDRKLVSQRALEDDIETPSEYKKDIFQINSQTFFQLCRIYGPAIACELLAIALCIASHGLMRKRLMQLATAYAALDASFESYRARARAMYGKGADEYLLTGIGKDILPAGTTLDGEVLKSDEQHNVFTDTASVGPYAFYFTSLSNQWKKDMSLNLMQLGLMERWANTQLHLKGHLFLNNVREQLGYPPVPEGQIVGWWDDPNTGDGKVSFGITCGVRALDDGCGGYEHAILINPNVDGPIYERLRTIKPEVNAAIAPDSRREIGLAHPEGLQLYA